MAYNPRNPVKQSSQSQSTLLEVHVIWVECAVSQVQSYPYKHIRDALGWISTDAFFLAPHVNARKF